MRTFTEVNTTAALGQALRQRIGEDRYQLWFLDKTKFSLRDDALVVGVPNLFYQEWLGKKFGQAITEEAAALFGSPRQVRFTIDPELFQQARRQDDSAKLETKLAPLPLPAEVVPPPPSRSKPPKESPPRQRNWRRLDDFVIGACNRVAHAAALSVAETPGQGPNPLVIFGPVGTGKTHLLEGIAASVRQHHPDLRVCFFTAEEFTNRFLGSLRNGKIESLRKMVRGADLVLLDDLPFLARKNATQEEFLHTLDCLLRAGRQVVVTSDCHPRLADDLPPELADRLLGGVAWGLLPPDSETRLNLLRKKTSLPGQDCWTPDVLELLANQLRGNAREIEGAIHALRHYSRVSARPIDLALAKEALGEILRHAVRVVHLDEVEQAVCKVLGLEAASLRGQQRHWKFSHPRMLALYLARKHTAATYGEIGVRFGGRNHSTVVAGEKKVRQWLDQGVTLRLAQGEAAVRDLVERIERELAR